MFFLRLLSVVLILGMGSAWAQTPTRPRLQAEGGNGSDRGGGDGAAADFNIKGREMVEMLERWQRQGTLPVELNEIDIPRLHEVVAGTLIRPRSPLLLSIDLCRYHPDVTGEQPGCEPDRRGRIPQLIQQTPVTATQGVGSPFIELDPFRWLMLREFPDLQSIIAFHEYYGVMGREDRNYELSRVVARLIRQERDDQLFRSELANRLRIFADALRRLLTPDASAMTAAFAVMEQTEEYRRCVRSPERGERATECRDLGAWMRSVSAQVSAAVRTQTDAATARAREAEVELLNWSLNLPQARQDQVHLMMGRLQRSYNYELSGATLAMNRITRELRLETYRECPQGVVGQAVQCIFRYARRLFTRDLQARCQQYVTAFDSVFAQIDEELGVQPTR